MSFWWKNITCGQLIQFGANSFYEEDPFSYIDTNENLKLSLSLFSAFLTKWQPTRIFLVSLEISFQAICHKTLPSWWKNIQTKNFQKCTNLPKGNSLVQTAISQEKRKVTMTGILFAIRMCKFGLPLCRCHRCVEKIGEGGRGGGSGWDVDH